MKSLPASPSRSTIARNPHLYGGPERVTEAKPKERRISQNHKPLLNELEKEFQSVLITRYGADNVYAQAVRLRLANGTWYKPDFVVGVHPGTIEDVYEVKGPHAFRGGFENLKRAASTFPRLSFFLVWKENGQWKQQVVLP